MTKKNGPLCCITLCFEPAFYSEKGKLYCDKHGLALHSLRLDPPRAFEGYTHDCGHCQAARTQVKRRREKKAQQQEKEETDS